MDPFYYMCFLLVCYTFLSVPCSLVVTCWERADLLVLLYVMILCVFFTCPYGVLGQVLYLIVLIPDLCLHSNVDQDLHCLQFHHFINITQEVVK